MEDQPLVASAMVRSVTESQPLRRRVTVTVPGAETVSSRIIIGT